MKTHLLVAVLALAVILPAGARAQAPDVGGGRCVANCGPAPGPPASAYNYAAAAAAAEAERQRQEAERQRKEAERKLRDAELRRQEEERQRKEAEAARLRKEEFERKKAQVLTDMKGISDSLGVKADTTDNFGLKGIDDSGGLGLSNSTGSDATQPMPAHQPPAWEAQVTDPRVARLARSIGAIVPPAPVPKEEVPTDWKHIYLNEESLMKSADRLMALWEMTGPLGSSIGKPLKVVMIAGKTFIAGENGAALYLVRQDQTYDQALSYLKNPAQSQQFARLVQAIRENRPLPSSADPGMVSAARAIADPKLAHGSAALAWDFMTSQEALSAMLRKAAIEIGADAASDKAGKMLTDENQRKAVFDALRLERRQAVNMMRTASTTTAQREQLKIVIDHANRTMADIYRVEKVADTLRGEVIGEATDKLATALLGPEAGPHKQE
jgi:hypothetical protein